MSLTASLNNIPKIMVFRPTLEEMKDFSGYISYMESQGAHKAGVAKIIPPKEFVPRKNYDDLDLVIPAPIQQEVMGHQGLYTQYNIQKKPMTVKEYGALANSARYQTPPHFSYEDLERKYWKNITYNSPIYGADISGSVYDKGVDIWNINHLNTVLDIIEEEQGVKIEGVNTAYLYFGMWKTTFAWHTEDLDLYSINYLHFGAPKSWYAIPPEHGKRLERLAEGFFPGNFQICSNFLRHKMTIIAPHILKKYSIPFNKITQEAGEFMVTFPYGYHAGFNHGYNCAESTNFASIRWINYGKRAGCCTCQKDSVKISMEPFVRVFQPDRYQAWKEGRDTLYIEEVDNPTGMGSKEKHMKEPPMLPFTNTSDELPRRHPVHKKDGRRNNSPHATPQKKKTTKVPKEDGESSPTKRPAAAPAPDDSTPVKKKKKNVEVKQEDDSTPVKKKKKNVEVKQEDEVGPGHSGDATSGDGSNLTEKKKKKKIVVKKKIKQENEMSVVQSGDSVSGDVTNLIKKKKKKKTQVKQEDETSPIQSGDPVSSDGSNLVEKQKKKRKKLNKEAGTSLKKAAAEKKLHASSGSVMKKKKKKAKTELVIVPDAERQTKKKKAKRKEGKQKLSQDEKTRLKYVKLELAGTGDAGIVKNEQGTSVKPELGDGLSDADDNEDDSNDTWKGSDSSQDGLSELQSRWVMFDHRYSANQSESRRQYKHKHTPRPTREEEGRRQMVRMRKGKDRCPSPPRSAVAMLAYRRALAMPTPGAMPSVLPQTQIHTHSAFTTKEMRAMKDWARSLNGLWITQPTNFMMEQVHNASLSYQKPGCCVCRIFYHDKLGIYDEDDSGQMRLVGSSQNYQKFVLTPEDCFAATSENPNPSCQNPLIDKDSCSPILSCVSCKMAVHASCYGEAPPSDGSPWKCLRCTEEDWSAVCCLCNLRGGALRHTTSGTWAHIMCAMAIPDVRFVNVQERQPIDCSKISEARLKLKCFFCRSFIKYSPKFGSCIQCSVGKCAISFHVTCANAAGVVMEPGYWPCAVFATCIRHPVNIKDWTRIRKMKEIHAGDQVVAKHKNNRYYKSIVKGERAQMFCHVEFTEDGSFCDNLYPEDIEDHNIPQDGTPEVGSEVQVRWVDGILYPGVFVNSYLSKMYDVEFEDGSVITVKKEDIYKDGEPMPKRVRSRLSEATAVRYEEFKDLPVVSNKWRHSKGDMPGDAEKKVKVSSVVESSSSSTSSSTENHSHTVSSPQTTTTAVAEEETIQLQEAPLQLVENMTRVVITMDGAIVVPPEAPELPVGTLQSNEGNMSTTQGALTSTECTPPRTQGVPSTEDGTVKPSEGTVPPSEGTVQPSERTDSPTEPTLPAEKKKCTLASILDIMVRTELDEVKTEFDEVKREPDEVKSENTFSNSCATVPDATGTLPSTEYSVSVSEGTLSVTESREAIVEKPCVKMEIPLQAVLSTPCKIQEGTCATWGGLGDHMSSARDLLLKTETPSCSSDGMEHHNGSFHTE